MKGEKYPQMKYRKLYKIFSALQSDLVKKTFIIARAHFYRNIYTYISINLYKYITIFI